MAGPAMNVIALWLRVSARPRMRTAARARRAMQQPRTSAPPPVDLTRAHEVSVRTVDGFDCWTVTPRDRPATRAVLYLHGGAYINGMSPQHWVLVGRLADAGIHVEVPLYGLAPEHDFRAAYALTSAVHEYLLDRFEPGHVRIAGDSAGGGLALGFAQTLLETGQPQPGRIVLIAPWLDLALTNPDTPAAERHDPWLSSAGLREAGLAWAAGTDPADPRLSPITGTMTGLAPISVWIGTRDLFHPDALELQRRAEADGVPFRLTSCPGAIHVYPLVPAPEGRAAAADIVRELSA